MQPPDLNPFPNQQSLQHKAAREREFHAQLVYPLHRPQVGVGHRAGLSTDAAPAQWPDG